MFIKKNNSNNSVYYGKSIYYKNIGPSRGFTLIEVLFSMSIIAIVAIIAVPSYGIMRDNISLNNDHIEIINSLRVAQNKSIASIGAEQHGVYFATSSYILYDGSWPVTSFEIEYKLKHGVTIFTGQNNAVEFSRLTGDSASSTIIIGTGPGKRQKVLVQPTGKIITY